MSTTVSTVSPTPLSPDRTQKQSANPAAPAHPTTAPDRIASSAAATAPLLTIGAAALAQLMPGVIEAEGATAIATTIGIGARAALANPAVRIGAGIAGTEALSYANGLFKDALNGQPGSQMLGKIAAGIDASVRIGLGIPQSTSR